MMDVIVAEVAVALVAAILPVAIANQIATAVQLVCAAVFFFYSLGNILTFNHKML